MSEAVDRNGLMYLNAALPDNIEANLVPDQGRIYYVDHTTQTSSWLPPRENWDPGTAGLPYGWEAAVDKSKKSYYLNHVENFTSRDDPRDDPDYVAPPMPREVELQRDPQKGFGFVAGSEKPVVVRFVTEGGPSVGQLQPGDQIIKINGQDVKKAPREAVIDLVRSCKQTISLTVCQPYNDNSARKSALLTAAKKDRLKKNPSRVRFAEEIIVNGASVPSNSPEDNYMYVPFMPNVLKVFMENGQTKSFKYDNKTTVKDVVNSLQEKLNIKDVHHFNLVLHNMKSHMPGRMMLLQEHETVAEIASRPGSRHFRCLFRVVYVPRDSYDLLKQDPIAFEYFYMQCVNDVLQDRFVSELKQETLLRLAALHIQQHAMSNNYSGKISIKTVEKEFGFEKFVPPSIREAFKVKDLRKVLAQCMKMNQNLTAPGQKQLTALQAKLHYMKIFSELKTFGSRVFMVTLLDKKTEAMVLVGPKSGVSLVTNVRFYTLSMLADFSEIECIKVVREKDNMHRVELSIKGDEPGTLNLGLLKDDATNFVSMVNGYYRIFVDSSANLIQKNAGRQSDDPEIPPYESIHTVIAAPWSYPEDIVSMVIGKDGRGTETERMVDLSRRPPAYEGDRHYIQQLKEDLGIKSDVDPVPSGRSIPPGADKSPDVTLTVIVPPSPSNKTKDGKNRTQSETGSTDIPVKSPIKTVIKIESPRPVLLPSDDIVQSRMMLDKPDSDSVSSSSSMSHNSTSSDQEVSPVPQIKVKYRSPTPVRKRVHPVRADEEQPEYMNSPRHVPRRTGYEFRSRESIKNMKREDVEYMNVVRNRKTDPGNSSDTDSGVGAEADRASMLLQTAGADSGRSNGSQEAGLSRETDSWDTPTGSSRPHSDLHLDLSGLVGSKGQDSPASSTSLDPDSSFISPFDHDQLPQEIRDAVYDPRMFASNEIYLDPDIIDLTLLPPFPPTEAEMTGYQQHNGNATHPHHMARSNSRQSADDTHQNNRVPLQKSASVGYCPDFLDNDIDAIIEHLTVQPPPTDNGPTIGDSENRLDHSWNVPQSHTGSEGLLEYENRELSRTVDLGSLGIMDEQYSSLVIPPPPEESFSLEQQDIAIVPPVESVRDRKKMFDKADSDGYIKNFGKGVKNGSTSVSALNESKFAASDGKGEYESVSSSVLMTNNSKDGEGTDNDGEKAKLAGESDTSPASVSEKLNALLQSLSTYDQEEESLGNFRRTSSLRLGRASSMDFLNNQKALEAKNSDLVTGSVRLIKPKVRPRLSVERTFQPIEIGESGPASLPVSLPLKTNSLERGMVSASDCSKKSDKSDNHLVASNNAPFNPAFYRTHSVDVLPTTGGSEKKPEDPADVSESFASLKAKLQSYRDSLLNRSMRRKQKVEAEKDKAEKDVDRKFGSDGDLSRKASLTRSNSFTSIIRRSLGRSAGREVKGQMEGRSSSETREHDADDRKGTGKSKGAVKEKKYWDTLTTGRSTFRPNTITNQTSQDDFYVELLDDVIGEYFQARLTPKPPLPSHAHHGSMGDKAEGQQKSGPLKAMSALFDQPSSKNAKLSVPGASVREKSPKRMAPRAPAAAANQSNAGTNQHNPASQSNGSIPVTSSTTSTSSQSTASKNSSKVTSSKVTSSVTSSTGSAKSSTGSGKSTILASGLTKPLTMPTAPPRKKHLTADRAKSPLTEKKSKDDSEVGRASPMKSLAKASPFATLGKMWRPMSMTSSALSTTPVTDEDDTYHTYNNFDILRDMKGEQLPLSHNPRDQLVDDPVFNGHAAGQKTIHIKATTTTATVPVVTMKAKKKQQGYGTVSEKSFALLKEKLSANHSNTVKRVLDTVYTSEDFSQATSDVDRLLAELKSTMESLKSSRIDKKPVQFDMCKEELQAQVRQFVTDAKLLVSNATQTRSKLAVNMNSSMHSLGKIFLHGQATMFMMEAIHQAQHLGSEVMRVANAYKSTLNAACAAVGKPLADPHMKYLMRQATNLASLLSTLLKSLKTLEQK